MVSLRLIFGKINKWKDVRLGDEIDIVGFILCGILIFAWIESVAPKRSKRSNIDDPEMMKKANADLMKSIKKHNSGKNSKSNSIFNKHDDYLEIIVKDK